MFKCLLKLVKSSSNHEIIKYMHKNKLKNEDMGIDNEDDEDSIYANLPNDDNVDYEDD